MEVRLSRALLMEVIAHRIFGILLVRRMPSKSQDSTNEGRNLFWGRGHLIITSTLSTYTRVTRADIQHKGDDNLRQQAHRSVISLGDGCRRSYYRGKMLVVPYLLILSWQLNMAGISEMAMASWSGCLLLLIHSWAPEYKTKLIQGEGDKEESLKGGVTSVVP